MLRRFAALAMAAAILLSGASKKVPPTSRAENEDLILTATLHLDPEDIKELIGSDLGRHYIVFDVKVEPKYSKDIVVDRDDFVLRTDKDGEKTQPYAASQIAGNGALVISMVDHNEGVASPGWTGTKVPVVKGGGAPAPAKEADESKPAPKEEPKEKEKDNPLKKTLDAKVLPEGKTDRPISGLLYFPMEKQKMKDLELLYGGKENRIRLRFKQ
jgi:hypothetical protein